MPKEKITIISSGIFECDSFLNDYLTVSDYIFSFDYLRIGSNKIPIVVVPIFIFNSSVFKH